MGYLLTAIVLFVVFYSIFKKIRSGRLPENHYTPFDDLAEGKVEKVKDEK